MAAQPSISRSFSRPPPCLFPFPSFLSILYLSAPFFPFFTFCSPTQSLPMRTTKNDRKHNICEVVGMRYSTSQNEANTAVCMHRRAEKDLYACMEGTGYVQHIAWKIWDCGLRGWICFRFLGLGWYLLFISYATRPDWFTTVDMSLPEGPTLPSCPSPAVYLADLDIYLTYLCPQAFLPPSTRTQRLLSQFTQANRASEWILPLLPTLLRGWSGGDVCCAEVCWWLGSVDHLLSPNALGESLLVFLLVVQLRSESRILYSTNFYPSLGCSSKGAGLLRGKGMRGGC